MKDYAAVGSGNPEEPNFGNDPSNTMQSQVPSLNLRVLSVKSKAAVASIVGFLVLFTLLVTSPSKNSGPAGNVNALITLDSASSLPNVEFHAVKRDAECLSTDRYLGKKASAKECAHTVSTNGGIFFVFGTGDKAGYCYQEDTQSADCKEGWQRDQYDFYSIVFQYWPAFGNAECSHHTDKSQLVNVKKTAGNVYTKSDGGSAYNGFVTWAVDGICVSAGQTNKHIRVGLTTNIADAEDFPNGKFIGIFPDKISVGSMNNAYQPYRMYDTTDVLCLKVKGINIVAEKNGAEIQNWPGAGLTNTRMYAKVVFYEEGGKVTVNALERAGVNVRKSSGNVYTKSDGGNAYNGYVAWGGDNVCFSAGQTNKHIRVGLTTDIADAAGFPNGKYIGIFPQKLNVDGKPYTTDDVICLKVVGTDIVAYKRGKEIQTWAGAAATSLRMYVKVLFYEEGGKLTVNTMGKKNSVNACAHAIKANNGRFFVFGKASQAGECYQGDTVWAPCSKEWDPTQYDFYSLQASDQKEELSLVNTGFRCANRAGIHGSNAFSRNFNSPEACAHYMSATPGCGKYFSFEKSGWCECVVQAAGKCIEAPAGDSDVYIMNRKACVDKVPGCDTFKADGVCKDEHPDNQMWRSDCVKTCGFCDYPLYRAPCQPGRCGPNRQDTEDMYHSLTITSVKCIKPSGSVNENVNRGINALAAIGAAAFVISTCVATAGGCAVSAGLIAKLAGATFGGYHQIFGDTSDVSNYASTAKFAIATVGAEYDGEDDLIVKVNGQKVLPAPGVRCRNSFLAKLGADFFGFGGSSWSDKGDFTSCYISAGETISGRMTTTFKNTATIQLIDSDDVSSNDDLGWLRVDPIVSPADGKEMIVYSEAEGTIYQVSYTVALGQGEQSKVAPFVVCGTVECVTCSDQRCGGNLDSDGDKEDLQPCPSGYVHSEYKRISQMWPFADEFLNVCKLDPARRLQTPAEITS